MSWGLSAPRLVDISMSWDAPIQCRSFSGHVVRGMIGPIPPVKMTLELEIDSDTASDVLKQWSKNAGCCPSLAKVLGALVMNLGKEE